MLVIGALLIGGKHLGMPDHHHGVMLGAAAGVLFGVSDIAIKALTGADGIVGIVTSPWLAVTILASVVAFYASARGMQDGEAVPVIAATSTAANVSCILGGIIVFGDPMPSDADRDRRPGLRLRPGLRRRAGHPAAAARRRGHRVTPVAPSSFRSSDRSSRSPASPIGRVKSSFAASSTAVARSSTSRPPRVTCSAFRRRSAGRAGARPARRLERVDELDHDRGADLQAVGELALGGGPVRQPRQRAELADLDAVAA